MKIKKIFFDVDTQEDFMDKKGALYVPGAEGIRTNLEQITKYARSKSLPLLGSLDMHFGTEKYKGRETELQRNGGPFPDHCMVGTRGCYKIKETRFDYEHRMLSMNNPEGDTISHQHYLEDFDTNTIGMFLLELYLYGHGDNFLGKGLYFEKQTYDAFSNPALEFFLKKVGVEEAVVYGVATDYCVKAAVIGMLERGIKVYVIEDAIKGVTEEGEKQAINEMKNKGAKFVTTKQFLEDKLEE